MSNNKKKRKKYLIINKNKKMLKERGIIWQLTTKQLPHFL
ncbi:hypothetical protein XCR1_940051 [Xenorhabdus cabanillasii JM26]|uniref:Uncharacterized protein n=2 Tax=Xenorhabdus cabanillasii TaxID=351673 RepID=A0A3D9UFP6_9GAMM|nr:hypothetical protein BDD26_1454 [Xenorhabdus cabanillasii]CDL87565.1 hypothetical protein XCR1_940051 [Xenorhabdus cabanillasii JM26]